MKEKSRVEVRPPPRRKLLQLEVEALGVHAGHDRPEPGPGVELADEHTDDPQARLEPREPHEAERSDQERASAGEVHEARLHAGGPMFTSRPADNVPFGSPPGEQQEHDHREHRSDDPRHRRRATRRRLLPRRGRIPGGYPLPEVDPAAPSGHVGTHQPMRVLRRFSVSGRVITPAQASLYARPTDAVPRRLPESSGARIRCASAYCPPLSAFTRAATWAASSSRFRSSGPHEPIVALLAPRSHRLEQDHSVPKSSLSRRPERSPPSRRHVVSHTHARAGSGRDPERLRQALDALLDLLRVQRREARPRHRQASPGIHCPLLALHEPRKAGRRPGLVRPASLYRRPLVAILAKEVLPASQRPRP